MGYLNALSLSSIASAPEDRVATAAIGAVTGGAESGTPALVMAVVILVSTFGCLNGLILSGSRVLYAMSRDGLFLKSLARVAPRTLIPVNALGAQALWAALLCLSGTYGDLLDYVIPTVLIFYVATIAGRWKLARTTPSLVAKTWADRIVPVLYVIATLYVTLALAIYKPRYTLWGFVIVALGIPAYLFFKSRQTPAPQP